MRPRPRTLLPFLALCGASTAACLEGDDTPHLAEAEAALTAVIPPSNSCNQGLEASQCVQAPPVSLPVASRWTVDGIAALHEYEGATEIPYTLDAPGQGGHGRVLVQRVTDTTAGASPKEFLYLFFDRLPTPVIVGGGGPDRIHHAMFDFARFDGVDAFIRSEDRRVVFDLGTGVAQVQAGSGSGSTATWTTIATPAGFQFSAGGCAVTTGAVVAFCSGELRLALPTSATAAPGAGLAPGIGLFVRHRRTRASGPERSVTALADATNNRSQWPTINFAPPRGFPLRIMSWNVRRFGSDTFSPAFDAVSEAKIGAFLALNDVVTIQEGWDHDEVLKVLDGANAVRTAAGLPKFELTGPGNFSSEKSALLTKVVSTVSSTTGGIYVMSHLPVVSQGYQAFPAKTCRGEDCFKAKGVLWTRLALNSPDTANPACVKGSVAGTAGCPKLPSGDDYVDVFSTHLQADKPMLCSTDFQLIKLGILGALWALEIVPPFSTILQALIVEVIALMDADLNCFAHSDAEARAKQLDLMNSFVAAVQGEARDRPVVLTGDFNIDGRDITGAEYRGMLQRLKIAAPATPSSDLVTITPGAYGWDLDHGDVVRELTGLNFSTGRCLGTDIGETGGTPDPGCPMAGNFDGTARLDYILVRPPELPAAATKDPRWVVVKGAAPWASPFPSPTGAPGLPPDRLSDHKPVVTSLTFAPLANPPKYHPTWAHKVELRVTGLNATGFGDCFGCGPVDPYVTLRSQTVPAAPELDKVGAECTDDDWVKITDPCNDNWHITRTQGTSVSEVDLRTQAWDDDDTSGNDLLHQLTKMRFIVNAGSGRGGFGFDETIFNTVVVGSIWPIIDVAPYDRCGVFAPELCHRLSLTELPPGQ
jgi:hypothetical protein